MIVTRTKGFIASTSISLSEKINAFIEEQENRGLNIEITGMCSVADNSSTKEVIISYRIC